MNRRISKSISATAISVMLLIMNVNLDAADNQVEEKAREIFNNRFTRAAKLDYPIEVEEVAQDELGVYFPDCSFFIAKAGITRPSSRELLAACDNHVYGLPQDFNMLLKAQGIKIDSGTILSVARGFILAAQPYPDLQITFENAEHIDEVEGGIQYHARVDSWSKENGVLTRWRYQILHGQIHTVRSEVLGTRMRNYAFVEHFPLPQKGTVIIFRPEYAKDADLMPVPTVTVDKSSVITTVDGAETPDADRAIVVSLSGFRKNKTVAVNITTRVGYTDITILTDPPNNLFTFTTDEFGNAAQEYIILPNSPTGISVVTASVVSGPAESASTDLVVEQIKTDAFTPGYSITLYYTLQAFHLNETWANDFTDMVMAAAKEAYDVQVTQWGFDEPIDDDFNYEIAINDGNRPYHEVVGNFAVLGPFRLIGITSNILHYAWVDYSSEEAAIKEVMCHEFFHGLQYGYIGSKVGNTAWGYLMEGQARLVQSIQYESEEYNETGGLEHWYPGTANGYLQDCLNLQLTTLSYTFCLYWRFIFEHYDAGDLNSDGVENEIDQIQIIKGVLEQVGLVGNNALVDGEKAIDNALAAGGGVFKNFDESTAGFSIANYFNDIQYGLWDDPYSLNIYDPVPIEQTVNYTGSPTPITIPGDIAGSRGMDFIRINVGAPDKMKIRFYTPNLADTFRVNVLMKKGSHICAWPISCQDDPTGSYREGAFWVFEPDALDDLALAVARIDLYGPGDYTVEVVRADDVAEKVELATAGGLQWLCHNQAADGAWLGNVGTTGLVTLAFCNEGYRENDGHPLRSPVKKGVAYMLGNVDPAEGSIYNHAVYKSYHTSLAAIALFATGNPNYLDEVNAARSWLIGSQWTSVPNTDWQYGGFGYGSHERPDMSNTQFALMALSFGASGIVTTPAVVWDDAVTFIQRCQNLPLPVNDQPFANNPDPVLFPSYNDGGFVYIPGWSQSQPNDQCKSYGSITAAGIWCYLLSGVNDSRVDEAVEWLEDYENPCQFDDNPNMDPDGRRYQYYYYLSASKALLMRQIPTLNGDDWYDIMSTKLADLQHADGHWESSYTEHGDEQYPENATSFSVLALEVKSPPPADYWMQFIIDLPKSTIGGAASACLELHVYDPEGRHLGMNYETGMFDSDIPGGTLFEDATGRITATLGELQKGTYRIELVGLSSCQYSILLETFRGTDQVSSRIYGGQLEPGQIAVIEALITTIFGSLSASTNAPQLVPADLVASLRDTAIILEWAPVAGASGYRVYYDSDGPGPLYRGTDATQGPSAIDVGNATELRLTGLSNYQQYYVAITAYGDLGESPYSREIICVPMPPPMIVLDKVHDALQGHFQDISISISHDIFEMGGFDFLVGYDASALTMVEVMPGQILDDCGWEYFTYRYGAQGNCGDACPSGLLRAIALAETNNGPYHPGCFGPPNSDPQNLATIRLYITNDRTFNCQYLPIQFFWYDCGDNAISSIDGDTLYVDLQIYDIEGNLVWDEDDDDNFSEGERIPFVGIPDQPCMTGDKERPKRFLVFVNGGIDVLCSDSIDARGDINVNGIVNEVADAVMFTNYFVSGLSAFDDHVEASIAASDVNADGVSLSVADLVYLVRIITGDASPFPKPTAEAPAASISALMNHSAVAVSAQSQVDLGAGYFEFAFTGCDIEEPQLINGASDMTLKYSDEDGILKVLVYSMEKDRKIPAGIEHIFVVPISGEGTITLKNVELSDYFGNLLTTRINNEPVLPTKYAVRQNYPNPFNTTTTIMYELPVATHVKLNIFNTLGQRVTTLVDRDETAGIHSVTWGGTDALGKLVASGVYVYRLSTNNFSAERKMILMK